MTPPARLSWTRLGAALGAGVLTGLCFPPVDLGPLVLVSLVPLLWAWRGARPRHAALYGFAFGIALYVVVIPWIRYFGYVAFVPMLVVVAAPSAGVGALVAAHARRGLASPFLTAAAWVVFEALLGRWPLGGFPWAQLGVALHDSPAARALAGVGGTLLVSFVVVAVNGLVFDLALALRRRHDARGRDGRGGHRRPVRDDRAGRHRSVRAAYHRASAGGDAAGRRRTTAPRPADRPAPHREALRARGAAPRPLRPHRVPGVSARYRPGDRPGAAGSHHRPRGTTRRRGTGERAHTGERRRLPQHQPAVHPDGTTPGHLLQAAPRALR